MAILALAQLAVTPQPASPAAVDLSVMAAVRAIEEWHHVPQGRLESLLTAPQLFITLICILLSPLVTPCTIRFHIYGPQGRWGHSSLHHSSP